MTALPDRHHTTSHMLLGHTGMLHQTPAMQMAMCCWVLLPHLHRCKGVFKKRQQEVQSRQAKLQTDWKLIEGGITILLGKGAVERGGHPKERSIKLGIK